MKKTLLVLGFLITGLTLNAQSIADNAIGLRLGSNDGFGAEITYQRGMSSNNRLEINLGLRNGLSDFKAVGLYQWVWNLEDRFNWYAGAGGGVYAVGNTTLFASGVIGIEYNFAEPILVSLDYRPEIGINNSTGLQSDLGLSVRYQF